MISTVGKSCFIGSLYLISSCIYGTVTLTVKDLKGIPLKEVAAGYPCKIELTIDDANRRMENPEIKGLSQFHLEGRETSMQMINGSTTVTYGFRARCNKPGSYTIGPAELSIEGKKYSSNVVTITVISTPAAGASHKKEESRAFARVHCIKKQAVVGEKVPMSMRFYYTNHDHIVRDVGNPPEQGYTRKNIQGPLAGTELINGVMHHYVEWTWDIYPTSAGTLLIPAYSFDYDTPKTDGQDHVFAGFSLFFNHQRYDRHRIYSNACEIVVDSVPETDNKVSAVGQFSSFSAHITPAQVKQGDGMVLTLELVGEADFDTITLAPLSVPRACRWYDSQTTLARETDSGHYKKSWEYIVQGLQPGSYEIPAQNFTYFDTKKRRLVTMSTAPLSISIVPAEKATLANNKNPVSEETPVLQSLDIVDPSGIRPIHESGQWYGQQERFLPAWLYILLMALPMVFVIARWIFNTKSDQIQRIARKRWLLKQARLQLAHAERIGNGAAVYPLCIMVARGCLLLPESIVTDLVIERALERARLDSAERQSWQQFFMEAASYAFYMTNTHYTQLPDFFKQAERWLDICEKRL